MSRKPLILAALALTLPLAALAQGPYKVLKTAKVGWSFKTDGARQNLVGLSKPDGTTNYETVFTENFFDNMIVGVYKLFATGSVLSSPVVAGDSVYFGSTDGNLYAVN